MSVSSPLSISSPINEGDLVWIPATRHEKEAQRIMLCQQDWNSSKEVIRYKPQHDKVKATNDAIYQAKRAHISVRDKEATITKPEKKEIPEIDIAVDCTTPTQTRSASFYSFRSDSCASSSSSLHSSPSSTASKDSCLSIMKASTDSTECQLEFVKSENEKLRAENEKLRQSVNQLKGNAAALHALDMEELCELEEVLMLALYKVRRDREEYYNYFCVGCNQKQTYMLYQGCDCNALCFDCIKQRQEEKQTKCPDCDEWYT